MINTFPILLYGDKKHAFAKDSHKNYQPASLLTEPPFAFFSQELHLSALVILSQVHGTEGLVIKNKEQAQTASSTQLTGDFILTAIPSIGLGIETADCLALTLYDSKKHVLGIAHAGWRGSMLGIAQKLLQAFYDNYQSSFADIHAYFSPAARSCCYEVGPDIANTIQKNFDINKHLNQSLLKRDNRYFLDLPIFNKILLEEAGVPKENIDLSKSLCAIHTLNYCSYRRDGKQALRNLMCAVIRDM